MSHQCAGCGSPFTRADNLRRHAASRTCSGIALQHQHGSLENSRVTYSPDQLGAGYERVSSEASDSENQELSEQEADDEGESDQTPSYDERSECEESKSDEEKTNQDATDCDDDEDMSDKRSDSEDSSDDYEDENTDTDMSSEDEAVQESNHAFKHFGNARYRFGDNVVYAAWKSRKNIPYVVQQREWLKTLRNAKPERWRQLLNDASDPQLEAFREIAYNVMRRRVVMHRRAMLGLDKNSDEVYKLAHIGNSYEQLRHLLKVRRTDVVLRLLMWGLPQCIKSDEAV